MNSFPEGVDPNAPENLAQLAAKDPDDLALRLRVLRSIVEEAAGDPRLKRKGGALDQIRAIEAAQCLQQPPAQVVSLSALPVSARRLPGGE
jgi:hypothetical protein